MWHSSIHVYVNNILLNYYASAPGDNTSQNPDIIWTTVRNIINHTVFRQINALGVEADNEPLASPDLNENCSVDPWIP